MNDTGDRWLLVRALVDRASLRYDKSVRCMSMDAVSMLVGYSCPSGVGELEEMISLAVKSGSGETLEVRDFPLNLRMLKESLAAEALAERIDLSEATERFETAVVAAVLHRVNGDRTEAARFLGVSLDHLNRRCDQLPCSN